MPGRGKAGIVRNGLQGKATLGAGAGASYGRAIAANFTITNTYNGELTRFSMTYGTEGRFAQVPLTASYQPRWWMEVTLTLDDTTDGPALTDGVAR